MPIKEFNILAINPGTKYFGLGVFQGAELVYWGIKVFKGKWSAKKMRNIGKVLEYLIARHHITVLTLKALHPSRTSRNLNRLVVLIENLAAENKLKIYSYSLHDLKKSLGLGTKTDKSDIGHSVVERYRFLGRQLEMEKKHKHPYYTRMFEAIAAGIATHNRLKI